MGRPPFGARYDFELHAAHGLIGFIAHYDDSKKYYRLCRSIAGVVHGTAGATEALKRHRRGTAGTAHTKALQVLQRHCRGTAEALQRHCRHCRGTAEALQRHGRYCRGIAGAAAVLQRH